MQNGFGDRVDSFHADPKKFALEDHFIDVFWVNVPGLLELPLAYAERTTPGLGSEGSCP